MKQNYLKELMTALLLLCCTVASAQDFEVGGINYNILSSEDKTVEVRSGSNKYTGSVTIPASVTYNGEAYSVKSIGNNAFRRWHGLTSIEIPSSVTSIGERAFEKCDTLTSIVVGDGNTVYDSRGNCNAIIETASNTLILGCKNTIIPEGVTSIGNHAFHDCTSLTSIVIPEGVTRIGDYAFSYCSNLKNFRVPSELTSVSSYAFYYNTALSDISALSKWNTSNVVNMDDMFYNASSLTDIDGVSNWDTSNVVNMNKMFYKLK